MKRARKKIKEVRNYLGRAIRNIKSAAGRGHILGMTQAVLDIAVNYAKERATFSKPIIKHRSVDFRLAYLVTRFEVARQMILAAMVLKDNSS